MLSLIEKAETEHELNREELLCLLSDASNLQEITAAADRVRHEYVGDEVHLRGLIEFSNICKNNCCYCGLRRDNTEIYRYRLDEDTIFKLAEYAVTQMGLKTIVLQSGEDMWFNSQRMCALIGRIKTLDAALTLSVGEKSAEEYLAYKQAGCDRFLLRIETTDKILYKRHDPGMSWERRRECLNDIRRSGMEVGSGCLVGLPGQTLESLADDILFFKQINADMVGIGPFIPHPDTPLRNAEKGNFDLSLKVMALTRLLLPDINIPATTAMETLAPNGQTKALQSGANVIMPNVTLNECRKYYELYPGKSVTNCSSDKSLAKLRAKISSIGRSVATDKGFRKRQNNLQIETLSVTMSSNKN